MSTHAFTTFEHLQTFFASGSEIFSASTQSAGFLSSGSSISLAGLTGGSKSSSKLPDLLDSPLSEISNVLLGLIITITKLPQLELYEETYWTTRVYRLVSFSMVGLGENLRCFSSFFSVTGLV